MGKSQLQELKGLEKENTRLKRIVADLELDKLILKEAAEGNFQALHVAAGVLITFDRFWMFMNKEPAGCLHSQGQPGVYNRRIPRTTMIS